MIIVHSVKSNSSPLTAKPSYGLWLAEVLKKTGGLKFVNTDKLLDLSIFTTHRRHGHSNAPACAADLSEKQSFAIRSNSKSGGRKAIVSMFIQSESLVSLV